MTTIATPRITLEMNGQKGRYVAVVDGIADPAELTFSKMSDSLVIADHTGVPDALRGMGIGRALVERLVADAREKGFKIIPLCPYVNATRQKHPEWADLFQG